MEHFDAVERVFLRDPRVCRVFVTCEHLYFVHIGNITRVDDDAIAALNGLSPEEMLSLDPRNYRVAMRDVQRSELITSHFLLGHGLFWRFQDSAGKHRTFVLHQWGDMTSAVAVLLLLFGQSLSTAKVDGSMRSILDAAAERARHLRLAPDDEAPGERATGQSSFGEAAAAPKFQTWQHSRTRLVAAILFICVMLGVFLRYGCR
jgi:hypothetical protein